MAADDLVIYNGVSMRRDYAESLKSAQRLAFYRVGGRDIARFGDETNPMVTPGEGLCQCCSTARGQFHEPLSGAFQCQSGNSLARHRLRCGNCDVAINSCSSREVSQFGHPNSL
jgi:hypothetical protein